MTAKRVLLVGNPERAHLGAHLRDAAKALGLKVRLCDARDAFDGPAWFRHAAWRLGGRRPLRLSAFSNQVVEACLAFRPDCLIATGLAPVNIEALTKINRLQIRRLNYLTDDPWNPAHHAPWFMQTLTCYDHVFSPRRGNIESLLSHGCRAVSYLPFAYAPAVHFSARANDAEARRNLWDVSFAGGADADRVPVITALIQAGFRLALYGGYWGRYSATRPYYRGHADDEMLRRAVSESMISLCLVRRANRDGHVMRSFEIPAMGGCMLAEDTEEHREIFGPEREAVLYFRSIPEMIEKARWLMNNEGERNRLATAAHTKVLSGENTYQDRLAAMLP